MTEVAAYRTQRRREDANTKSKQVKKKGGCAPQDDVQWHVGTPCAAESRYKSKGAA